MDAGLDEYGDIADLYDYVVPYRERADVGFFVEAATTAGGPVLELGCGTGRVLIPTVRAGIEVTGLDLSARMLAVCRQRLADEPEAVRARARLVEADMRRFDARERFAMATIPFRPFQHLLTIEDQLACLSCIRSHLVEDGALVVDLFNPSLDFLADIHIGEEGGAEPEFTMPDGRRVAGFRVEHLYSDLEKHPYGHVYPGELIFVARKA
jgi:SAM-dependent methyltransferase